MPENGENPMEDAPVRNPDCLTVEEMEMHLSAQERPEEREIRAEHLRVCANCATEFKLLREFLEAEPRPEERADVDWVAARLESPLPEAQPKATPAASWLERLFSGGNWALVGAAAAAMLAVGIYLQQGRAPEIPGGLGGGAGVVRSASLSVVGPEGDLAAAPELLEVEAAPDAVSYRFQVEEVDRSVLWSGESSGPSVALPGEVRAAAIPGKTLVWRAFALDGAGGTLGEAAPVRFRVEPGVSP